LSGGELESSMLLQASISGNEWRKYKLFLSSMFDAKRWPVVIFAGKLYDLHE
jgi:hypothetical protein